MAILCIRVTPNPQPDPALFNLRHQPGDVVCIVEDGHKFSYGELNCGNYKFIPVAGASAESLSYLCDPQTSDGTPDGEMVGRCKFGLNVNKLIRLPAQASDIAAAVVVK